MLSLAARPSRKIGIDLSDYCYAAESLGCSVSAIRAVDAVESAGSGFLSSGRPKILFEGHLFDKYTNGRFRKSHPTISYPVWTKAYYKGGESEYKRLEEACKLDPSAALKSTSWSRFQILAANFRECGFNSVEAFVEAMFLDEDNSLEAFVRFIMSKNLAGALKRKDFRAVAYGYNGSGYKRNAYDTKMANAERQFARIKVDCRELTSSAPTPIEAVFPADCHETCTGLNNTSLDDRYLSVQSDDEISESVQPRQSAADEPAENSTSFANNSVNLTPTPSTSSTAAESGISETGEAVPDTGTSFSTKIQNAFTKAGSVLDTGSSVVNRVDQAKSIFNIFPRFDTTETRSDSAKSKATTVWGTFIQITMFFVAWVLNIPFQYWAILAVILGVIALAYMFRQTVLGFIRETTSLQNPDGIT